MLPARPSALVKAIDWLKSVAPLRLAGGWDNVGLLVDSIRSDADTPAPFVVFFTNDLTDKVVAEAASKKSSLIVTYHPTPFSGIKKLTREDRAAGVTLSCLASGISVYSPHTAMDCTQGGVNDWLASCVLDTPYDPAAFAEDGPLADAVVPIKPDTETPRAGEGRIVTLREPISLRALVDRVKAALRLDHLQLSIADKHLPDDRVSAASVAAAAETAMVSTIGICAGSGRSVLGGVKTDVWLTGEMSHHDCLAAAWSGTTVLVTNHTNTERGFLPHLAARMADELGDVEVHVSELDADPLVTL